MELKSVDLSGVKKKQSQTMAAFKKAGKFIDRLNLPAEKYKQVEEILSADLQAKMQTLMSDPNAPLPVSVASAAEEKEIIEEPQPSGASEFV